MKKVIALILALTMVLSLVSCGNVGDDPQNTGDNPQNTQNNPQNTENNPQNSDKPIVKMGANFVMTGGGSAANIDWAKPAVEKAVADFNAGDHEFVLELVPIDCQNDASLVGEKNTELLNAGVVGIIGPNSGNLGIASLEWANENQIPVFSTGFTPSSMMCQESGKYGFNPGLYACSVGYLFAAQIIEAGYQSVYFVGNDASDNLEIYNSILSYLSAHNYSFNNVGQNWFPTTETDFTNVCSAAVAADPDCIVSLAGGPTAVSLMQTGQLLGLLDYPLISTMGFGTDTTMALGDSFPSGVISFELSPWYVDTPENAAFYQYSQDYYAFTNGIYPSNFTIGWLVAAYSMIQAIEEAYDPATQTAAPDDIVAALETIEVETPIGTITYRSADEGHLAVYDTVYLVSSVVDTSKYDYAYGEVLQSFDSDFWPKGQELIDLINAG